MNRKTQIILLKTRDGDFECLSIEIWGQFHHHFTRSFYTRRSQKLLDLTVFLALSVPAHVKSSRKHVDENDPWPALVFVAQSQDLFYQFTYVDLEFAFFTPYRSVLRLKISTLYFFAENLH